MNSARTRPSRWLTTPVLAVLMLLLGAPLHASDAEESALRTPLFKEATAALRTANRARAALLAPTQYRLGADAYREAETTLTNNGNLNSIRRELERAQEAFDKAAAQAAQAAKPLADALQARDDAENAEAPTVAEDRWRAGDLALYDAAMALEKNRASSAERAAAKAVAEFRAAELDAIKANYLSETRSLLETAEDKRAERYAPQSLAQATTALAAAEEQLTNNRYDTDEARNLAQQARHAAQHAIYIADAADALRRRRVTLESVLAEWETAINRLADQLDQPVYFDTGPEQPLATLQDAVVTLQSKLRAQDTQLAEANDELVALRSQLDGLSQELGEKSQATERLNAVLAEQQALRNRFAELESRFRVDKATVLRKGSTVIVRLIGLTFDSGSATLKPEHTALLEELSQAIALFPGAKVIIEGHTDSFGSDADNLELSQQRANAVADELIAQGAAPTERLTALGYGESQPLANNETAEGRRRNRRIDVVLYP
ncbi:MAG: OmpA family protein [Pseudomonadota bacterium]